MSAQKVARFCKVSLEQFMADIKNEFGSGYWSDEEIRKMYNDIKLPERATVGAAGYDFFTPFPFSLGPGKDVKIPTGIRAMIDDGWVLVGGSRSGSGFKYLRLANCSAYIDSDYSISDNEGHIWFKMRFESEIPDSNFHAAKGDAFAQGIFFPHGITYDDCTTAIRNGGLGSTDKKKVSA